MSRIDYSKWDNMDFSDSEDDECSSSHECNNLPNVTRLDEPSRVTCSPNGVTVEPNKSFGKNLPDEERKVMGNDDSRSSSRNKKLSKEEVDFKTKNGGTFTDPHTNKVTAYWSQDRYEAVLWIKYAYDSIKSSDIRVDARSILSYDERHTAAGGINSNNPHVASGSKGTITVTVTGCDVPIFQGHLAYPCHFAQGEDEIDWEVSVSGDAKMIRMTLLKAVPIQCLTIWWSRPFLHFPSIDVTTDIKGRDMSNRDDGQKTQHEQWKETWDEAHRLFRENIKHREKQLIHVPLEEDSTEKEATT